MDQLEAGSEAECRLPCAGGAPLPLGQEIEVAPQGGNGFSGAARVWEAGIEERAQDGVSAKRVPEHHPGWLCRACLSVLQALSHESARLGFAHPCRGAKQGVHHVPAPSWPLVHVVDGLAIGQVASQHLLREVVDPAFKQQGRGGFLGVT